MFSEQLKVLALFAGEDADTILRWQVGIEIAGDLFVSQKHYETKDETIQAGQKVVEALKVAFESS